MTAKRIKSKTKSSNNEEEKKTQHHKDSAIKKDNNVEHKQEEKAENKEAELIKEGLEAIYGEDKMDFSKLERSGSRISNILLTIVITLTILAGAAWSGFFVYMKFFSNQNAQLFTLDIEMEENIKSGQPTNIEILYSNPTAVQIASLELDVRLPASFKVTGMSHLPDDFDEFLWDIGTLPANSNGKIDIEGIWITEVPSSTPVQIFANFRPSNFNSDFQEIETKYVSTTESVITSKISGPDEISPGQIGEYIITIKNDSEETFENIAVELNLPDGFYLEDSNPY
ncbi:hypothetical protein KJ766_02700, partial [Patescibacteria group bacterium]|nr:hypothetical protein [Patescibacteria group bacterium]